MLLGRQHSGLTTAGLSLIGMAGVLAKAPASHLCAAISRPWRTTPAESRCLTTRPCSPETASPSIAFKAPVAKRRRKHSGRIAVASSDPSRETASLSRLRSSLFRFYVICVAWCFTHRASAMKIVSSQMFVARSPTRSKFFEIEMSSRQ